MDALADLLDGPRARGAFVMRSLLDAPWALRVQDRAPLTVMVVTRGHAYVVPDDGEPTRLDQGAIAIVRGPDPYTVADEPSTPPQAVVHPGQTTTTPEGELLCETWDLGVRSWGTNPDGTTALLTGTYEVTGSVSDRLLRALPARVILDGHAVDERLLGLLVDEAGRDIPGQASVLDRLLDLLTIAALRAWFAREDAPRWYRAYADPVVGQALRLLEHNPAHDWTVAELATTVGASRAALARRFTDLVGDPPIAYLTEWRLARAADLLRGTDATIESIARQVGYGTAFSLSAAFKRRYGVSPGVHRRADRGATDTVRDAGAEG
ncbi:AraC family transcriptional regulator [Nocardia vermiculata]|uniref:AraC family transcriptional regulator n=1 Tax=Nocardia vermiculata TaxID=257274 RepID=A0A846Y569_9NOCA|nr:AraC family transcriptional regulator [Nocardia vermiculata]NKY52994.1 AraC family transcriptional regulator [Nocardia vermiculata]